MFFWNNLQLKATDISNRFDNMKYVFVHELNPFEILLKGKKEEKKTVDERWHNIILQ